MRSDQQHVERPKRKLWPTLESLEGRSLLSGGPPVTADYPGYGGPSPTPTPAPLPAPPPTPTPAPSAPQAPAPTAGPVAALPRSGFASTPPPAAPPRAKAHRIHTLTASGVVTKSPSFYSFYTGPRWAELNAIKASGKLVGGHTFVFTGTNQGKIDQGPATYVWGVDRNGFLPPGPFTGRPNITFDALVTVRVDSSLRPTATVTDLVSGATTTLPASAVRIRGATVRVKVPAGLLPSTGLPPSQYGFNYWPEATASPGSVPISSFAPESGDAQVGVSR